MDFTVNASTALTIASTGAATFAGTITANNKVTCDNGSGSGYLSADGGSTKVGSFSNHRLDLVINNSQKAKLETNGNFTVTAGSVSDSKGDVRICPQVSTSGAVTVTAADAGKHLYTAYNVTIPGLVAGLGVGTMITVINRGTSDITIIPQTSSGMEFYVAGDTALHTSARTLTPKGLVTILYVTSQLCWLSGAGIS